ncbi:MAG TPA: tripartite tricarboxylate transporter substrate binding protein [Candidatus Sulfotelmatobacter sp.]|nr:tripartite tricarboxylate transporter substrate binding protein [Candidatus Sulfotelmatobacter sp.]
MLRLVAALLCAAVLLVAPAGARAAAPYPERPVRVIVPYPPGGGADTVARILFAKLGQDLGGEFIIENRPGGNATIGAGLVARAAPDGYVLLHDATGHSINPSLLAKLPYDTEKDFAPIFLAVLVPNLLVVNNQVPVRTVADVIALAKATPGGLDWASSGNGSAQHMALELFRQMAGITLNHIPYRGGGPVLNDLMAGQIKFYFSNATASTPFVKAGSLKAIAHTGRGRLVSLPDLPPVSDTLPGYECFEWNGVFAPAGTPRPIVERLNAGLNAVIKDPVIAQRLVDLNAVIRPNTPEEFGEFVTDEIAKWTKVVRAGDIKVE